MEEIQMEGFWRFLQYFWKSISQSLLRKCKVGMGAILKFLKVIH